MDGYSKRNQVGRAGLWDRAAVAGSKPGSGDPCAGFRGQRLIPPAFQTPGAERITKTGYSGDGAEMIDVPVSPAGSGKVPSQASIQPSGSKSAAQIDKIAGREGKFPKPADRQKGGVVEV